MSDKLHDFLDKYVAAMEFSGTPMNGLARAELHTALKESGAEEILEMMETIRQHEEIQKAMEPFTIPYQHSHPPIITGTTWISDSTSNPGTGIINTSGPFITTTGGHTNE